MAFDSYSPNSLILILSGVSSDSFAAPSISYWILPTSVCIPVPVTTPRPLPTATSVAEKIMLSLAEMSTLALWGMTSGNLWATLDSPVSILYSINNEIVFICMSLMSAGTLLP